MTTMIAGVRPGLLRQTRLIALEVVLKFDPRFRGPHAGLKEKIVGKNISTVIKTKVLLAYRRDKPKGCSTKDSGNPGASS